jgi:hypothetical protein
MLYYDRFKSQLSKKVHMKVSFRLTTLFVVILSTTSILQSAFAQNSNASSITDDIPVSTINGTISADYTIEDVDSKMLIDDAKAARDGTLRLITKAIERHVGENNTNSVNTIFTDSISNLTWNMVGINPLLNLTESQLNNIINTIEDGQTQYRFSITIESACNSVDPKFSTAGCSFTIRLH